MDFPIKNGDFPLFFVCLPEGTWLYSETAAITRAMMKRNVPPRGVPLQCTGPKFDLPKAARQGETMGTYHANTNNTQKG